MANIESTGPVSTWEEFSHQKFDHAIYFRLLKFCRGNSVEAVVLWDVLVFHKQKGLQQWSTSPSKYFESAYKSLVLNGLSVRRAIESLTELGLLEQFQVPKTSPKMIRINWPVLAEGLSQVSPYLPGLDVDELSLSAHGATA